MQIVQIFLEVIYANAIPVSDQIKLPFNQTHAMTSTNALNFHRVIVGNVYEKMLIFSVFALKFSESSIERSRIL